MLIIFKREVIEECRPKATENELKLMTRIYSQFVHLHLFESVL